MLPILRNTAAISTLSVCLCVASGAWAISGTQYAALPEVLRVSYVAGALDAWQKVLDDERRTRDQSKFGSRLSRYFSCFELWGNDDYRKALDEHFTQNEAQLEYGAATGLLDTMETLCPKR